MLKGFKDFIMRGNVVDLAVGIVIGAAFTGVVTQLTKSFLEPLIRVYLLLITGSRNGSTGTTLRVLGTDIYVRLGRLPQRADHLPAHRGGALLPGRLSDEQAGGAASAWRGTSAGRAERRDQAAHRDPGRARRRRPDHPRAAARRAGRRARPPGGTAHPALNRDCRTSAPAAIPQGPHEVEHVFDKVRAWSSESTGGTASGGDWPGGTSFSGWTPTGGTSSNAPAAPREPPGSTSTTPSTTPRKRSVPCSSPPTPGANSPPPPHPLTRLIKKFASRFARIPTRTS